MRMKKVRVYPLKNADGTAVPNTYVFATEDYNVTYDQNDVIGIIHNVTPGPNAGKQVQGTPPPPPSGSGGTGSIFSIPSLSVQNLDTLPANDRVVFNSIENPDPIRPNVTHSEGFVKITNKGSSPMTIDSISSADSTDFQIVSGGGSNITLGAGKSQTIAIEFVGAGTGSQILKTFQSDLLIKSGGQTDTIVLSALWQAYSEQTPATPHHIYDEASLSTIVNTIFGYKTDIADPGQTTTKGNLIELGIHGDRGAVGSEVLSAYWQRADSSQPVKVRMLAAFHRQDNFDPVTNDPLTAASSVRWYNEGSSATTTKIFVHNINEGQSLLPNNDGSTTAPAQGSFSPSGAFGFKVDHLYGDDSLNPPDFNPDTNVNFPEPTGHAIRFYPLVDENGHTVPNTYIMAMDYTGLSFSNYDYNDNIYIVSNISPTGALPMAVKASAAPSASLWSTATIDGTQNSGDLLGTTNSGVL